MNTLTRRTFAGMSAMSVGALLLPGSAMAQAQCVTALLPPFLPNMLTVDCASRRNFKLFRQNSTHLGLTGVVSMSFVRGRIGTYPAGNLFLFPWLKPKGLALGAAKVWNAVAPTDSIAVRTASPIPGSTLPQDEYFCNTVLQAPATTFIGFGVDVPFNKLEARLGLYTNVDRLADGQAVGIDWASSNLNHSWFGGSRAIPGTDACYGKAWRQLIVNGVNLASAQAC